MRTLAAILVTAVLAGAAPVSSAGTLNDLCMELAGTLAAKFPETARRPVYFEFRAQSSEGEIYPVAGTLKTYLDAALSNRGFILNASFDQLYDNEAAHLRGTYSITPDDLFVTLTFSRGNSDPIGSATASMSKARASDYLWERSLDELAEELAGKLTESRFGRRLSCAPVGAAEKGKPHTSEFGQKLFQRMTDLLGTKYQWTTSPDTTGRVALLELEYIIGKSVVTASAVLRTETEKNVVSVECPIGNLKKYRLYPQNAEKLDQMADLTAGDDDDRDPNLLARIVTNHSERGDIFKPGQSLEITVIPLQDCYLRLFYVEATGDVRQILPNQFSAKQVFLRAGERRIFGTTGGNFRFTITGEPVGQESIIAFITTAPIDDSDVKAQLIAGAGFYDIIMPADELRGALTRGLQRGISVRKQKAKYNFVKRNILVEGKEFY